jgi:Mg2+/Co2+ transporter CorB
MIAQAVASEAGLYEYLSLIGCLLLSAFFSGSETAFFSLSKIQLKKLENQNSVSSRRTLRLLRQPRMLLITILLGNTVVNITAASLGALITLQIGQALFPAGNNLTGLLLVPQILLMTVLLLVIGEITPKLLAFSHTEGMAAFAGFFLEILKYVLWPVIKLLELISKLFSRRHSQEQESGDAITSEDFRNLIQSKTANHPLEEHEKKMMPASTACPPRRPAR